MDAILQTISAKFLKENLLYSDSNFTHDYLKCLINNKSALVYNGLVPYRRQAIIWTYHGPIPWCMYTSPGLNVLGTQSV